MKGQLVGCWGLKNGSQSLLYPPGHWSSHLEMAGLEVVGPSSWDWPLLDLTTLPEEVLGVVGAMDVC